MYQCARCGNEGTADVAYCQVCGQSRIGESLLSVRERPEWLPTVRFGLVAIALVWFIVTVGVAFLREAKALRRGRQALEAGQPATALSWLEPFVAERPRSEEGLALAATAAVRHDRIEDARRYRDALGQLSVQRSEAVDAIFRETIAARVAWIGCSPEGYQGLYPLYSPLGEEFAGQLQDGARRVVRRCFAEGDGDAAFRLGRWLLSETSDPVLVTGLYIEEIKGVLAAGSYVEAATLAQQAARWIPEVGSEVHGIFDEERGRVRSTIEQIKALSARLRNDGRHRVGRFWCFPATLEGRHAVGQDGWGRPLAYAPLSHDATIQCYEGFELTSLGADGSLTPDDQNSPASEVTYRFIAGQDSWSLPDRYWLLEG